jgi:cell division protein FtsL
VLIAVITALSGLFVGGGLAALFRINADRNKVVVDASQGAVIVQTGVIVSLQGELLRVQKELHNLRDRSAENLAACTKHISDLRSEIDVLKAQVNGR